MQLVAATQRLDHDLVAVDSVELRDRRVERGCQVVTEEAQTLEDVVAGHAEDERAAEPLHQEVKGAAAAGCVLDDDDWR